MFWSLLFADEAYIEMFSFDLSWAKVQCGAKATANELKTALGKARYLIRFGEMIPSAVANGPSKVSIKT